MIIRSFVLVSRLPSHQIADRRIMHIQMSSYLLLSIAVFLHGSNDLLISFSLVQDHIFREYLIERWPVHIPMTLGVVVSCRAFRRETW